MRFDLIPNLQIEGSRLVRIMRKTLLKMQFQSNNNMYACALLGTVYFILFFANKRVHDMLLSSHLVPSTLTVLE